MKELGRRLGPACRPFRCSSENHTLLFLWLLPVGPCPPFLFLLKRPGTERKRKPRLCSGLCCQECVCSRSSSKNKTGQSPGRPARAAEHGNKGARLQQPRQPRSRRLEGNLEKGCILSKMGYALSEQWPCGLLILVITLFMM